MTHQIRLWGWDRVFDLRCMSRRMAAYPEERFHASYMPEPMSGCWLWLGAWNGSLGYGEIKVNKRYLPAHRYSWQLHNGEIPSGLRVLHNCDNPPCVNPSHLFLGTHQDNMEDMKKKGRQSSGQLHGQKSGGRLRFGEQHANSKLTEKQVCLILSDCRSQQKIAAAYNVSQTAVSKIKRRVMWQHITTQETP